MTIAVGPFKQLVIKKETVWGTLAGASGGQLLTRKSSSLDEKRNTYSSESIRTDQQRGTFAHGTRRAEGNIVADMIAGGFSQLVQSHLRRDFTAVAAMTGLSITVAVGSIVNGVQLYTVTRATGDFLAGGVKEGMVVRLAAGSFNAANLNKNLFVNTVSATVLTVAPWGDRTMVAEGPIASATVSVPGKITYVPASGHTNDSYTCEHRFTDLAQYEVFSGCRVNTWSLGLPPSGLLESTFGMLGRGYGQAPGGTPYFTSPTAASTQQGMTAVNGLLRCAGQPQVVLTGLDINSNGQMTTGQVVGSNYTPDVFVGTLIANGQLTAYFDSATLRDAYYNEATVGLSVVAYAGTTANADFVCCSLPAIKLGDAGKSDGNGPIILTCPYEAIFNAAGGSGQPTEATTVWVQDSQAA